MVVSIGTPSTPITLGQGPSSTTPRQVEDQLLVKVKDEGVVMDEAWKDLMCHFDQHKLMLTKQG